MWYTATYVHTPTGWESDLAIEVDESGMITDMGTLPDGEEQVVELEGLLVPGFVNAHCHLELSALKGLVPEGMGMAGFVGKLMAARATISDLDAKQAIGEAMDAAHATGTVAFGDICNGALSIDAKRARPHIFTHSFIELLGLDNTKANHIVENGKILAEEFKDLEHSLTLHAPYSVSPALRTAVQQSNQEMYSFHLHESKQEIDVFRGRGGSLWQFLKGIPLSHTLAFPPTKPIAYLLKNMPPESKMLWVHLAEISALTLASKAQYFEQAYACLCPRANQYIHQSIPDVAMLQRIMSDRICIGTDSLASNHDLHILEELRMIQRFFPSVSLHTLISWATAHGSEALGIDDRYGTFVPGTQPGIVLISQTNPDTLAAATSSELLVS